LGGPDKDPSLVRMADRSRWRPLAGCHQDHLNDRDGREAESPVLRALTTLHDVVWPKAVGLL
jgi:hypothetical protein